MRREADAGLHCDVVVCAVRGRAIEADHFVVEIGDGHAGKTGAIEIRGIHAHSGARFSFGAEGDAGFHGDVLECAIALIAIELVGLRVVGYEQIGPAVAIVIEHGDAQRFRAGVKDAALGSDVLKSSIAAIVKKPASLAAVGFRRAVGFVFSVEAAENVVLGRPLHVIADEKIEQAVAIVVEPERRRY